MIAVRMYIGHHSPRQLALHLPEVVQEVIDKRMAEAKVKGYTVFPASGHWEGSKEPSTVVEVYFDHKSVPRTYSKLERAAKLIAQDLDQDSVLVTRTPTVGKLISTE